MSELWQKNLEKSHFLAILPFLDGFLAITPTFFNIWGQQLMGTLSFFLVPVGQTFLEPLAAENGN